MKIPYRVNTSAWKSWENCKIYTLLGLYLQFDPPASILKEKKSPPLFHFPHTLLSPEWKGGGASAAAARPTNFCHCSWCVLCSVYGRISKLMPCSVEAFPLIICNTPHPLSEVYSNSKRFPSLSTSRDSVTRFLPHNFSCWTNLADWHARVFSNVASILWRYSFQVRFFYSTVSYWYIGVYKNWLNQPTFSNLVLYSLSNVPTYCLLFIDWLTLGKDKVSFLNSHISLQRFFFLRFSHRSETRFTFWYRC